MPSILPRLAVHDGRSAALRANVAIPAYGRQISSGGGPGGFGDAPQMTP